MYLADVQKCASNVAFGGKADIGLCTAYVRFWPKADIQRPDPNPATSSVHKSATMPCSVWARRRGRPRYSILARVG